MRRTCNLDGPSQRRPGRLDVEETLPEESWTEYGNYRGISLVELAAEVLPKHVAYQLETTALRRTYLLRNIRFCLNRLTVHTVLVMCRIRRC